MTVHFRKRGCSLNVCLRRISVLSTQEKHRPGLARKLYYLTKVNAADWPRTLKQRRFFTAIRAALKMVKADFEKRNIPVPSK